MPEGATGFGLAAGTLLGDAGRDASIELIATLHPSV